ncbi:MAG TPA: nucleoside triphosphate pyrophosphatase [Woeseiaceae bacterium]
MMQKDVDNKLQFYLASSSPRRRELLSALGLTFAALPVEIDESRRGDESPGQMVVRLAVEKARRARSVAPEHHPVLAADTVVALGDQVFGKPASRQEALAMLAQLSGNCHDVFTGIALDVAGKIQSSLSITQVQFRELDEREAIAYWNSGEPADKAGAYAIQGLGGAFVKAINGSYSGVVGLPVFETIALLRQAGIDPLGMAEQDQ